MSAEFYSFWNYRYRSQVDKTVFGKDQPHCRGPQAQHLHTGDSSSYEFLNDNIPISLERIFLSQWPLCTKIQVSISNHNSWGLSWKLTTKSQTNDVAISGLNSSQKHTSMEVSIKGLLVGGSSILGNWSTSGMFLNISSMPTCCSVLPSWEPSATGMSIWDCLTPWPIGLNLVPMSSVLANPGRRDEAEEDVVVPVPLELGVPLLLSSWIGEGTSICQKL